MERIKYVLKGPFVQIAQSVAKDPTISAPAKAVLLALAAHTDDKDFCFPSYETLMACTGFDRKTVWRALKLLIRRNIIRQLPRKTRGSRYLVPRRDGYVIDNSDVTSSIKATSQDSTTSSTRAPCMGLKGNESWGLNGTTTIPIQLDPRTSEETLSLFEEELTPALKGVFERQVLNKQTPSTEETRSQEEEAV